jgi:hypothetical protein
LLSPQVAQAEVMYQAVMDHPHGLFLAKLDENKNVAERFRRIAII